MEEMTKRRSIGNRQNRSECTQGVIFCFCFCFILFFSCPRFHLYLVGALLVALCNAPVSTGDHRDRLHARFVARICDKQDIPNPVITKKYIQILHARIVRENLPPRETLTKDLMIAPDKIRSSVSQREAEVGSPIVGFQR